MRKLHSTYLFLIIILLEFVNASKLNLVVLQSSDAIFKNPSQSVNTNTTESDGSSWVIDGFTKANATQISNSFGDKVNASTHLLLATKSSCLTTRLKDFGHTLLSIKFSSIIGRSVEYIPFTTEEDSQPFEASTEYPLPTSTSATKSSTLSTTSLISPAILKLNTDSKYGPGKDIIQIALAEHEPINQSINKRKLAERETPMKLRRKRTLNSEEISQIHKIISLVSSNDDAGDSENKDVGNNKAQGTGTGPLDPEVRSDVPYSGNQQTDDPVVVINEPKKLSYETWRASMDKSFRPPGFYITVDDKVIFDNWIGVWSNPDVMGRWTPPTRQKLWNETELLLEFEENPDRDIKITFEWEPMDTYSYVFLSNITMSTYGPNITGPSTPLKPNTTDSIPYDSTQISRTLTESGNKNITLYIVIKSPSEGRDDRLGSQPEHQRTLSDPDMLKLLPNAVKEDVPKVSKTNTNVRSSSKPEDLRELKSQGNTKERSQTVLYVAIVTGVLSFIILVTLIQKKMNLSKRQGRGC